MMPSYLEIVLDTFFAVAFIIVIVNLMTWAARVTDRLARRFRYSCQHRGGPMASWPQSLKCAKCNGTGKVKS